MGVLPTAGVPASSSETPLGLTTPVSGRPEPFASSRRPCSRPASSASLPRDRDPFRLPPLFLCRRIRRNTAVQRAIPAATVTTTMTTMLVPRLSEPSPPPPSSAAAVFTGLELLVGTLVSNMSLNDVLSVIKVLLADGWLSGPPAVVDVATRSMVVAACMTGVVRAADSVFTGFRPGVRGCVSSMVRSASTHRI